MGDSEPEFGPPKGHRIPGLVVWEYHGDRVDTSPGLEVVAWATPLVGRFGRRIEVTVVCFVLVSPGALLFWAGTAVLKRLGVPTSRAVK